MNKTIGKIMASGIGLFLISLNVYCEEYIPFLKHSNSWIEDKNGCELEGDLYPIGEKIAMNRKAIELHEKDGGYVSDGEAILMECSYLVDSASTDHPKLGQREYVWVSFSWTTL